MHSIIFLYLVIHLLLELHDLVLHPDIEFFKVFGRTGFYLELFELALGAYAAVETLDDDGSISGTEILLSHKPTTDGLLYDHGFVMEQELRRYKMQLKTVLKKHEESETNDKAQCSTS